jgi:hypothetical protein
MHRLIAEGAISFNSFFNCWTVTARHRTLATMIPLAEEGTLGRCRTLKIINELAGLWNVQIHKDIGGVRSRSFWERRVLVPAKERVKMCGNLLISVFPKVGRSVQGRLHPFELKLRQARVLICCCAQNT